MALRADILTPIPGSNPSGESLRYDPIYDKIKEARKEDPFQEPPVKADWRAVTELSSEAIAKKSKDLQLAAWLTEALLRREGVAGLREGLELVSKLMELFWDTLYPEIEDGDAEMRAAPLAWLGSYLDAPIRLAPVTANGISYVTYKASEGVPTKDVAAEDNAKRIEREDALKAGKIDAEEFDKAFAGTQKAWYKKLVADLDASLVLVDAIEKVGDQRLKDAAPSFRKLRDCVRELRISTGSLLSRKLELDPDPPEEQAAADAAQAEAELAAGGTGQIPIAPRNREDAARRIAAVAKFLRTETPADPASYLLLRGFRWGELRAGGPNVDPMILAAPPTEVRTRLKGLMLRMQWPELVDAAEDVMATPFGRGWLDLQRYVVTAVDNMGPEFEVAGKAIRGALRSLLRDIPGLPDMTLMDDLPTANAETRTWLKSQGIVGGAGEEPEEEAAPSVPTEAVDRLMRGASVSNPQRAVDMLMRAAAQEKSERSRFLRKSEAARIMVDSGLEAVASPILEEMLRLIDDHKLEDWEASETVALPMALLHRCMAKLQADSTAREELYLRVCRLHPLMAMQLANNDNQGA
jgi:type VI secretion system protein ImpA